MKTFASLAVLVALASPTAAAAEPSAEARVGGDWVYTFRDDLVGAPGVDALAPRIVVRPRGATSPLVRPRTQFVSELLKSVEAL